MVIVTAKLSFNHDRFYVQILLKLYRYVSIYLILPLSYTLCNYDFEWGQIYIPSRLVTLDTVMRAFQYKALHNIHFLNEKLFLFIKLTHLYLSFFVKEDKTVAHFFFSIHFSKHFVTVPNAPITTGIPVYIIKWTWGIYQ